METGTSSSGSSKAARVQRRQRRQMNCIPAVSDLGVTDMPGDGAELSGVQSKDAPHQESGTWLGAATGNMLRVENNGVTDVPSGVQGEGLEGFFEWDKAALRRALEHLALGGEVAELDNVVQSFDHLLQIAYTGSVIRGKDDEAALALENRNLKSALRRMTINLHAAQTKLGDTEQQLRDMRASGATRDQSPSGSKQKNHQRLMGDLRKCHEERESLQMLLNEKLEQIKVLKAKSSERPPHPVRMEKADGGSKAD